jgi:hypothetical protein
MWSRVPWLAACAGVLLLTLSGCLDLHMLAHGNPGSRIKEAVTEFSSDLRWGRIDLAGKHVMPDRRADFLMLFKSNDSFQFSEMEIDLIDYDPEKEEAVASVRFTLYRPPSVQEIVLLDPQHWHYDRSRAKWYIDPDLELYENAGR